MRKILCVLSVFFLLAGVCQSQETKELKSLCRSYFNQNRNDSEFMDIKGGMIKLARNMMPRKSRKVMDMMHPKSMFHFTAGKGDSEAFQTFLSEANKLLSAGSFVAVKSESSEQPEEKNTPVKWFIVEDGDYITDLVMVSEQEENIAIFSINGRMSKSDAREIGKKP